jgi:hypothetical protein
VVTVGRVGSDRVTPMDGLRAGRAQERQRLVVDGGELLVAVRDLIVFRRED